GTACLGLVGLLFSYMTAQTIAARGGAFFGGLGILGASGVPVFMYFLSFLSHPPLGFLLGLFFLFWVYSYSKSSACDSSLPSIRAWFTLGILAGLLFTTYYVNAILWVFVLADMIAMLQTWHHQRTRWSMRVCWALCTCLLLAAGLVLGVAPFMLVKAQI